MLSLLSAGPNSLRLSATKPESCCRQTSSMPEISSASAARRASSAANNWFPSTISLFTCPARSDNTPVTDFACASSFCRASSRRFRVRDNDVSPSRAPRSCGVASCRVSVRTFRACSNWGLSSFAGVVAQILERPGQRVGRGRPAQRGWWSPLPLPAGLTAMETLAEDGVGPDRGQRLVTDGDVAVHGEGDLGAVAGQGDGRHLADLETRDVDGVAGVDARSVGEVGVVQSLPCGQNEGRPE